MTISERIFKILEEKHITQKSFSEQTGIAQSTISDWKRRKTNPASDKIMAICRALEVTPEELLDGRPHSPYGDHQGGTGSASGALFCAPAGDAPLRVCDAHFLHPAQDRGEDAPLRVCDAGSFASDRKDHDLNERNLSAQADLLCAQFLKLDAFDRGRLLGYAGALAEGKDGSA